MLLCMSGCGGVVVTGRDKCWMKWYGWEWTGVGRDEDAYTVMKLVIRLGMRMVIRLGMRMVIRVGMRMVIRLGMRMVIRVGMRMAIRVGMRW